jgi:hypothetical protein
VEGRGFYIMGQEESGSRGEGFFIFLSCFITVRRFLFEVSGETGRLAWGRACSVKNADRKIIGQQAAIHEIGVLGEKA